MRPSAATTGWYFRGSDPVLTSVAETLAITRRYEWARLTDHAALAELWLPG